MEKKITEIRGSDGSIILVPSTSNSILKSIDTTWFDPQHLKAIDSIQGNSKGRHITWFIKALAENTCDVWVLRHYYRGGLVAKISYDKYFYTGLRKSRCYREIKLLEKMGQMDLPVPKPIAAKIIKKGLFYQADLLMEKLNATDLVQHLNKAPITDSIWQSIGATVARFHNKGIYHADLNAHNILLSAADEISLIDFDCCRSRRIEQNWQNRNLARLKRSLLKEKQIEPALFFDDNDWDNLVMGYMDSHNK